MVKEKKLLVNFNIMSLYTKIPIDDANNVIKDTVDTQTTYMVRICLESKIFLIR